eukprot:Skav200872  [mRNA]  locus=scaffold3562:118485:120483:- [translate_table: standard]
MGLQLVAPTEPEVIAPARERFKTERLACASACLNSCLGVGGGHLNEHGWWFCHDVGWQLHWQKPELLTDLKKMFEALNEVWEKVTQEEKDQLQKESPPQWYEAEMEIWKPKWEAYKKTDSYREFCLAKQECVWWGGGIGGQEFLRASRETL